MAAPTTAVDCKETNEPIRVLLIDDEPDTILPSLKQHMEKLGFTFYVEADVDSVASPIETFDPDVILLDLHFPGDDLRLGGRTTGGMLLTYIRREFRHKPVLLFTTRLDDNRIPLEIFEEQPHGRFAKPDFKSKDRSWVPALGAQLRSVIDAAKFAEKPDAVDLGFVVGTTQKMLEVAAQIRIAARNTLNVFICGESGTGKELAAEAIHKLSGRAGRFEQVNCSGVDDNTLQSDLFGHEAGAYTGAKQSRQGFIELADKGTLFLDEIQDMPKFLQDKLIKVIENGKFRRMGGEKDLLSDFRLITATNQSLSYLVASKLLREDLAYRLTGFLISLPPLRDRLEDLPVLVDVFLKNAAQVSQKHVTKIRPETLDKLRSHHWRGNIRELKNIIEQAVAMTTSTVLMPEDIIFLEIAPPDDKLLTTISHVQQPVTISADIEGSAATTKAAVPSPCSALSGEPEILISDASVLLFTDQMESLPIEDRYNFLLRQTDGELRKRILIEFIKRLRHRTGKKVQHKHLAEALDPLTNGDIDYMRIRQFVCGAVSLKQLECNK